MSVSGFTVSALTAMFPSAVERTYQSGQIVIYHGDQPRSVLFVISGAVKFYDIDKEGNEKILHIGGPGSFLPIFYSFERKPYVDAFYTTIVKSRFLLLPMEDFRRRIETDVRFAAKLLEWYAGEMDHMVLRLKSMERSSAPYKLLQTLIYLCDQHATIVPLRSQWVRVDFPLTQQMLAELTGLTRETVNVTLKEIEKHGVVRAPRKMTLEIHRKKLKKILDNSE